MQNEPAAERLIAQPMLFSCRTNHTRFFPKKHSFSYSYILVGIPIGWQGSVGGMLSVEKRSRPKSWLSSILSVSPGVSWYTVHADDYLRRGYVADGLRGKLEDYLRSQSCDPEKYPHAYLLTAGRFLGYAFNPVSIWYLYTPEKELGATVLEVNNTFDERHIYFLEASARESDTPSGLKSFSASWAKEFYVSPLNDRSGEYQITATDPLKQPLNAVITLASEGRTKLVARIFSEGPPLDPTTMTVWQKTRFLSSWWWVGFATFFIRTTKEAFKFKFLLGLRWYFRPEPRSRTISRAATSTEVFIEGLFRRYLRYLVSQARMPLSVIYTPAGLSKHAEVECMTSTTVHGPSAIVKTLDITVLTPTFYSAFPNHTYLFHAFYTGVHSFHTLETSDWSLLPHLGYTIDGTPHHPTAFKLAYFERVFFRIIQRLRFTWSSKPTQEVVPSDIKTCRDLDANWQQYTTRRPSAFDAWVLGHCSADEQWRYKIVLFRTMLARYIALGSQDVLDFEWFLARCALCWWIIW